MQLATPKAILFDWDNTLVDNWNVIRDALNDTLAAYGREPWTLEETHSRVAKSLKDGFPALFGDDWQAAQALFYERFEARHLNEINVMDGAHDVLKEVLDTSLYLGVVSNKRGDLLRAEAEHLGWSSYFSRIVGANDAPADKPAPDPIDLVLDGSGIPRSPAVWYIGDGAIDVECARNAGIGAILIHGGRMTPAAAAALAADCELASIRELPALVRAA